MHSTLDVSHVWTFADLQALPEDVDWRRYEIVDGALVVSPSTAPLHEFASEQVRSVIRSALPGGYVVIGPIAVDLRPSHRIPDLVVVPMRVCESAVPLLQPTDVLLVVEVVSPGSVTTDRITKPAQYAAAGIGAYWRVEPTPEPSFTAYELPEGADVYREVGTWVRGETAQLTVPFAADVAVGELVPPSGSAPTAK
jgi:Uma2 family endonuclease